jgi:hypothetical protein
MKQLQVLLHNREGAKEGAKEFVAQTLQGHAISHFGHFIGYE